jgi:hypothetical protein
MESYKLFIASSTGAKEIAYELWPRLEDAAKIKNIELRVSKWWENVFTPGISTMDALLKQCTDVQFAIVLLTPDDFGKKKGVKGFLPRDNCIYEAGLFTGSFGPDPERCFLLTGCDNKDLPTDLLGLTKIPIPNPPKPGSSLSETDLDQIGRAAKEIVTAISKAKISPRPVIALKSGSDLIKWERLEQQGGQGGHLKKNSQVMVSAQQPLELNDPEFANRVHENMNEKAGRIQYIYFFYADPSATNVIAELIWSLATVGIKGAIDGQKKMGAQKGKIAANLKTASKYLGIYLLRYIPHLEMCIHNAERADDAVCYLRYSKEAGPQFIEWAEGQSAKDFADSLRRSCKEEEGNAIFRATKEFDFSEDEKYKPALLKELHRLFPEAVWNEVEKYCFGDK